ncbi:hypothetical protein JCM8547_006594 [Rhodosporidiobolus lusitaniae]
MARPRPPASDDALHPPPSHPPSSKKRRRPPSDSAALKAKGQRAEGQEKLGTLRLLCLTLAMGGAQLVSSVQGAYGTSFLLLLGLSTQSTALVWLSGPIAGMVVQPAVGALSDSTSGRFRRRSWIMGSTACIVLSLGYVVYADAFGEAFGAEEGGGVGVAVGVVGVWALQFSMNGLNAAARDLILDLAPSSQQNTANAWGARLADIASILGYSFGWVDLSTLSWFDWIGGGQFRKLAWVAASVLVVTVGVTVGTQREGVHRDGEEDEEGETEGGGGLRKAWKEFWGNLRKLPVQVRRVCYVQLGSWAGLFPFMFYASTYVSDIMAVSQPDVSADGDKSSRAGSLALLLYALVAFFFASFLPWLTLLGNHPVVSRFLSSRPSRSRRILAKALAALTLRNIWTFGLLMHALAMVGTFWADTRWKATGVIAFMGLPWAITSWVPYALVMESVRELEDPQLPPEEDYSDPSFPSPEKGYDRPLSPLLIPSPSSFRPSPSTSHSQTEKPAPSFHPSYFPHSLFSTALLHRSNLVGAASTSPSSPSSSLSRSSNNNSSKKPPEAGGAILGIVNFSLCFSQLVMAGLAALAFKIVDSTSSSPDDTEAVQTQRETTEVIWFFRVGGLTALGGAVATRWLIETRSEGEYRERVLGLAGCTRSEGRKGVAEV